MYDLTTQRVRISRDVRWLGKFHVEGKYVDIPGYSRNNKTWIIQYVDDDDKVEEIKEKKTKIQNQKMKD